MAGSWPDMPSRKIAYHDDGTVVAGRYNLAGAPYENFYEWSQAAKNECNDLDFTVMTEDWANKMFAASERSLSPGLTPRTENVWIFPELRDIYGVRGTFDEGSSTGGTVFEIHTSVDTTNGIDGTWVLQASWYTRNGSGSNTALVDADPEDWRSTIETFTATGVRGVRLYGWGNQFSAYVYFRSFYIFGTISSGETPDRILYVNDSTGLEFVKPMDWGDVPRGTTLDWDIYLLNNSSTLAANGTMVLDFTTLYNSSDTWYAISDSGGTFGGTANVPTMAATTRYPTGTDVFTVRLDVPDDEPFGIYEAILELSPATSWT